MPVCNNCGYEGSYTGEPCPECGTEFTLENNSIETQLEMLSRAREEKDYEGILEHCHFLADMGYAPAEREYAELLERGDIVVRDFDLAMKYFYSAARKNDAYSAYRYSRLATRENDRTARFWLLYSAVLGCKNAYPEVAEEFSLCGYEEDAHYFYYLAAASDEISSIVTMAKRYLGGVGVEADPGCAKWYMDKLTIPPIYAIKLAYKLRKETAKEPPVPTLKNYNGYLRRLVSEAEALGFETAYRYLLEILSERGDTDAMTRLGGILVNEDKVSSGLPLLLRAAGSKNTKAEMLLGELYISGKSLNKSLSEGINYFISAGEHGAKEGYERAADVLVTEDEGIRDFTLALELYGRAEVLGSDAARDKADAIRRERDGAYELAKTASPTEAFSLYARAADMGHTLAMCKLAECMKCAIGTKTNRRGAFMWYKKAAELEETEAYYPLARCYSNGIGTALDFDMARSMFIKSDVSGDGRAHNAIMSLLGRRVKKTAQHLYSGGMRLIHKGKFSEAMNLLEISTELKHPKAIYTLGCLYEFGIGVPCDRERAYKMYEDAYALKFRDPRAKYKLIVLKRVKGILA